MAIQLMQALLEKEFQNTGDAVQSALTSSQPLQGTMEALLSGVQPLMMGMPNEVGVPQMLRMGGGLLPTAGRVSRDDQASCWAAQGMASRPMGNRVDI